MEPAEEAGTYFYFRRWSYKYFNEGDAARVFEASLSNSLKKLYWFVMTAGLSGSRLFTAEQNQPQEDEDDAAEQTHN